jgi:hypothetical protein
MYFDEFEEFLEDYFKPIAFIFDLYALDFTKIVPMFLDKQKLKERVKQKRESQSESSIAIEFNRWLFNAKFEE